MYLWMDSPHASALQLDEEGSLLLAVVTKQHDPMTATQLVLHPDFASDAELAHLLCCCR